MNRRRLDKISKAINMDTDTQHFGDCFYAAGGAAGLTCKQSSTWLCMSSGVQWEIIQFSLKWPENYLFTTCNAFFGRLSMPPTDSDRQGTEMLFRNMAEGPMNLFISLSAFIEQIDSDRARLIRPRFYDE